MITHRGLPVRELGLNDMGLKPAQTTSGIEEYKRSDVDLLCLKMINTGDFYKRKAVRMNDDTKMAIALTENVVTGFSNSIDRLMGKEVEFTTQVKKMSGGIKDASERIAQGIDRVTKAANFDSLERYVGLLERAATAMNLLAELEKSGKLEKITASLR